MPSPQELRLPKAARQAMLAHLRGCLPEEGCGLLGGQIRADGTAIGETVLPVENELHSPVRFRMNPLHQLLAMQHLEQLGQELVAIFHSHPAGPDHPSPTDLAEFFYPGVLVLIFSRTIHRPNWRMHGFRIEDSQAFAIPVTILPQPGSAQGV